MSSSDQQRDAQTADADQWAEARRRADVVARTFVPISDSTHLTTAEAAAILGIHRSTLYDWRERYGGHRRVSSLLPRAKGRPAGRRLLDARVNAIIDRLMHDFYLGRTKPRLTDLLGRIHAE